MTAYRVTFSEDASADIHQIELYVASQASLPVARRFTEALIERCEALGEFPDRGRLRDDWAPGIRTISHRRRVLVVYRVGEQHVTIVACFYRGRDVDAAMRERSRTGG
ncbi:MAG: toxin ParE1/3/4 [Sphingomonadales bacterium]|nr:toxin ParE1/3/4 [Sphingomonadales bacterium]MEA3044216.1 toxin ParE1/3/4 [Sphingomonadales bacterium]